mmetsp:Transcript_40789/g.41384  ORF Transcript_40789/g.41384 Transcript_40789/m.41384 type:complete len:101 (+) Transcript_40789:66-368(+)
MHWNFTSPPATKSLLFARLQKQVWMHKQLCRFAWKLKKPFAISVLARVHLFDSTESCLRFFIAFHPWDQNRAIVARRLRPFQGTGSDRSGGRTLSVPIRR